uniref:Uncharacterized protein n=1 Tax=Odontella aurita TaxID=265563 RepID=A0A7S4J5G6_9STRA|mmetsp:Transcript_39050/g.117356  ORF Transcript_39050/g.117356 Transcript_39050/m.117356 type:complete len:172 (+) Transcript_39050:78-593(+)
MRLSIATILFSVLLLGAAISARARGTKAPSMRSKSKYKSKYKSKSKGKSKSGGEYARSLLDAIDNGLCFTLDKLKSNCDPGPMGTCFDLGGIYVGPEEISFLSTFCCPAGLLDNEALEDECSGPYGSTQSSDICSDVDTSDQTSVWVIERISANNQKRWCCDREEDYSSIT